MIPGFEEAVTPAGGLDRPVSFAGAIEILSRERMRRTTQSGEPGDGRLGALRERTDAAVAVLEGARRPGACDRSWINMAPTVSGMPGVHVASRIGMCTVLG